METSISSLTGSALKTFYPFGKDTGITVCMFGRPTNWADPKNNPQNLEQVVKIAKENGAHRLYLPETKYELATVVEPKEVEWYYEKFHKVEVRYGSKISGLLLPSGSAIFLTAADDPILVVRDYQTGNLVVTKAGLFLLVKAPETDPRIICNGEPESVIGEIISLFNYKKTTLPKSSLVAQICGGPDAKYVYLPRFTVRPITQEDFRVDYRAYPKNEGRDNILLLNKIAKSWGNCLIKDPEDGQLSFSLLIKKQFQKYAGDDWRVRVEDSPIDIYRERHLWRKSTADPIGEYFWHCETRSGYTEENGFLVINPRC